jgi:A/G-specific adenine glycosylase
MQKLSVGRWLFSVERLLCLNVFRHKQLFHSTLLRWYRRHGRDLPWRRTQDPYAILVSEFMLQQTQVASVLPYYQEWLRRFPDFHALARASENDILHAWQGLGYYARSRNLHAAAKVISKKYRGQCPKTVDQLRALPGIGRYTANAVASFAFDRPVPVVEANIARVLARLFNLQVSIDSAAGKHSIWSFAAQLVAKNGSGCFNSALMDLGAMICLPQAPQCRICPVKRFCRAKNPATLPIKKTRPRTKRVDEHHAFATKNGQLLLQRSATRWRGMWILPPIPASPGGRRALHESVFPFTHHRITLKIYPRKMVDRDDRGERWFKFNALDSIPIPSPHRRAIIEVLTKAKASAN